ncbi:MAG: DNA recombination protein RmuC [Spirochaetaceae bacterium]|nr:DNA recombination protein RmuC [Spirochaetaceae bacterium]
MNQQTILIASISLFALLALMTLSIKISRRKKRTPENWYETFNSISKRLDRMEDMAGKVDSLSRIFTLPHIRGAAGETLLESLLQNWLPQGSYKMQYKFASGARADAVIKLGKFLVPIDSKFPLESISSIINEETQGLTTQIKRVFFKHCDDIAGKYIKPEEGTMQFALLYIPSEKIYYKIFIEDDGSFMREILQKGVLPVSPSNIFTYLQTIAYGLRGFSFSGKQKLILDRLYRLREDFTLLKRQYELGTTHLKNLQKVWDDTTVRLSSMDSAIERMERPED